MLALGISAFSLGNASVLRAQTATEIPAPDLTAVQPTVTAEMGDLGGKFFGQPPDPAKTKQYYIAAEPELWNFAPEGQDPVCGLAFPTQLLLNRASWKIRYVQYADPNFTARVLPTERLGILGQVLRGVTGQYLRVTFLNRAWRAMSMHPHGVKYDKDSEGSYYKPVEGRGAAVAPGGKFTYVWYLDEAAAPRPGEPSSKAWLYHSHVVGDEETNLGAVGFIIVTDPARARPDGTPCDVDREMGALFTIYNETLGGAVEDVDDRPANAPPPGQGPNAPQPTWAEAQQAAEEGQRHTINGRAFGNLGGLDMNEGERVRWYLFGLGSESDFHSAHWHGLRALEEGKRRTDVVELLPASMKVADTTADNPGAWIFHCHVAEHMNKGMFARVNVYPREGDKTVVSTDPEVAFFGMPQSLATLRIGSAEISTTEKNAPGGGEINLVGQVTVPDPFPAALNAFTAQIGGKSVELHPDASGLAITPEAIL
ncbi:MAG: multicopper oxidase domain-containing protein, partial [Verrucomicrobia bacterium]|nr:multicopper oxidase domain-containing protein [Verrucomicrobiota bacterium]